MNKAWVRIAYSIFWIVTAIEFYAVCLFPCHYFWDWGNSLPYIGRLLFYPGMFFVFIFNAIMLAGFVRTCFIPDLKEGVYNLNQDYKILVAWYAHRFLTEMVMLPFQRIILTNALLRYICLRLLGAKIYFSTTISSNHLNDYHLFSIGKNTTVGAWTTLYCHIQPNDHQLIVARSSIGDNCFIGGEAVIGVGSKIGNHVEVGYRAVIGMFSNVADNCTIGWAASIGTHCNIGKGVTLGKYAALGNMTVVADGVKLPDFSIVPDRTVVASQEMADGLVP